MSKLIEYVKEYGHLSFKEEPYNQIDAAIFSQLSIFNLDDIVGDGIRMKDLFQLYLAKGHKVQDRVNFLMTNIQHYLFEALSNYPRYKDLIVSNYVRINCRETICQFEALTIDLGEEVVISYGGTDDTLVGWHEDFLLIYREIEAHRLGREYLEKISLTSDKNFFICGHSKGANIALEVSLSISDEIYDKVVRVDCFDGPGLCFNEYSKDVLDRRIEKVISYIPKHSGIGRLFDHYETYKVVECHKRFAVQHDLVFWEIEGKDFIYLDERSEDSFYLENHISSTLSEMDMEERKGFVETIFKILYKTKSTNLEELSKRKIRVIFGYLGLKRKERKLVKRILFKKLLKDKRVKKILFSALRETKLS